MKLNQTFTAFLLVSASLVGLTAQAASYHLVSPKNLSASTSIAAQPPEPELPPAQYRLSASSTTLDLGETYDVSSSLRGSITLTNTGENTLTGLSFSSSTSDVYQGGPVQCVISSDPWVGPPMAPGESCVIPLVVTWSPDLLISGYSSNLTFTTDQAEPVTIALSGTGRKAQFKARLPDGTPLSTRDEDPMFLGVPAETGGQVVVYLDSTGNIDLELKSITDYRPELNMPLNPSSTCQVGTPIPPGQSCSLIIDVPPGAVTNSASEMAYYGVDMENYHGVGSPPTGGYSIIVRRD